MRILDLSAGQRAVWYNKKHPLYLYLDKREEVKPDIVCDTNKGIPDPGPFDLIVWDPPHLNCGPNSNMSKRYGHHSTEEILYLLRHTSRTSHEVGRAGTLMAFKWNTHDIPLKTALHILSDYWEPLFGHLTASGASSQTFWVMLLRR